MTTNTTSIPENHKRCSKCGLVKPHTSFHTDKSKRDRKRSTCIVCDNTRQKRYLATHREEYNRYQRAYYRAHPRTHRRQTNHTEYMRNYRAKYPERARDAVNRYHANNPEIVREGILRRRSRKSGLSFNFTAADEARALEYWHGRCAVCGRPLRDLFGSHDVAFDHWIPVSDPRPDNPGTVPWNMVPLCHGVDGCNNSKHNCDPAEWLTRKYGKRRGTQIIDRIERYFAWITSQEKGV